VHLQVHQQHWRAAAQQAAAHQHRVQVSLRWPLPAAERHLCSCTHTHCLLLLLLLLLLLGERRQPVFLTLCHMLACAALGYGLSLAQVTPVKPLKSKRQVWKVCLLATLFCITIVLGNMSLKYIPISFNQAIGATTPLFTAVFAFSMQGAAAGLRPVHVETGASLTKGCWPLASSSSRYNLQVQHWKQEQWTA
jgi:hypothetical protein